MQEEKGMTEDGIAGWHHRFKGREFEQTPGESEGQGSLGCCRPRGHRVRHDWEAKQVWSPEKSVWVPVSGPPRGWEVSSVQPRAALPASAWALPGWPSQWSVPNPQAG